MNGNEHTSCRFGCALGVSPDDCTAVCHRLLHILPSGFALHEMVLDEEGAPVDYVFLDLNPAFEQMTGLKRDDIVGRRVTEVLPGIEKDPADWIGTYGRVVESGEPVHFNQYSEVLDRWYRVTAFRTDPGCFAVLAEDITDTRERIQELTEQSDRLHAIFDSAEGVPIQGYREDRTVVFWNRASEKFYGYTREEAVGRKLEDLIVPEDAREEVIRGLEAWVREDLPVQSSEIQLCRKDGTRVWVYSSHVMIPDPKGGRELFCIDVDLTAQKQAEAERLRNRQLESLGLVAGGIAHDFNNLLTGVYGCMEMAKLLLPATHEAAELLDQAHGSLDKARELTGRLLTFSKGGTPVLEVMDLGAHVRTAVLSQTEGSEVTAVFDLPSDLWDVKGDRTQLDQLIGHVTTNALQAMPGGGTFTVSARNRAECPVLDPRSPSACVEVTFEDQGEGIPPHVLNHIFEPYFSTRPGGTGLGLAVSHSIVRKHQGAIHAESEPGRGTRLKVFLPAASDPRPDAAAAPESSESKAPAPPLRVLVMDDEEMVRMVVSQMLRHMNARPDTVPDGESALAAYREALEADDPFDLVILDLTIPSGMGGRETIRKLLEIDPDVRAIVASGYSSDATISDFNSYGFRGCLVKPFKTADLEAEMRRVLEAG